jgi:hypothetical protein
MEREREREREREERDGTDARNEAPGACVRTW